MTFQTLSPKASSSGDGLATAFPFPYLVFKANDLLVLLITDVTGVGVIQVLTTDYAVSGLNVDTGGTITMVVAPPVGTTLLILRDPLAIQETDLKNQGPFKALTHEKAFDRSRMIDQKLLEQLDRSLKIPIAENGSPSLVELPPLAQRLGLFLRFDPVTGAIIPASQGAAPAEILWATRGILSLSDNPFPRYTAIKGITFVQFDITVVTPGVGGDTVINILRNAGTIATITLPAGSFFAKTGVVAVAVVDTDEIYPEIITVAPTTPPDTYMIAARA